MSDSTIRDGIHDRYRQLIQASFARLEHKSEQFPERFYAKLFEISPDTQTLFIQVDSRHLHRMFWHSLVLITHNLQNPTTLQQTLRDLGRRHLNYGVAPYHYPLVGRALLCTLQDYLKRDEDGEVSNSDGLDGYWSQETAAAWIEAYDLVSHLMQEGAGVSPRSNQVQKLSTSASKVLNRKSSFNLNKPSSASTSSTGTLSSNKTISMSSDNAAVNNSTSSSTGIFTPEPVSKVASVSEDTPLPADDETDEIDYETDDCDENASILSEMEDKVSVREMDLSRVEEEGEIVDGDEDSDSDDEEDNAEEEHDHQLDVHLLRTSFDRIRPNGLQFVQEFYATLFAKHPVLNNLFARIDQSHLEKKLLNILVLIVENIENEDLLRDTLYSLGQRHVGLGVIPPYFQHMGEALIETMSNYFQKIAISEGGVLGTQVWCPETEQAWRSAYSVVAGLMLRGFHTPHSHTDPTHQRSANKNEDPKSKRLHNQAHLSPFSPTGRQSPHSFHGSMQGGSGVSSPNDGGSSNAAHNSRMSLPSRTLSQRLSITVASFLPGFSPPSSAMGKDGALSMSQFGTPNQHAGQEQPAANVDLAPMSPASKAIADMKKMQQRHRSSRTMVGLRDRSLGSSSASTYSGHSGQSTGSGNSLQYPEDGSTGSKRVKKTQSSKSVKSGSDRNSTTSSISASVDHTADSAFSHQSLFIELQGTIKQVVSSTQLQSWTAQLYDSFTEAPTWVIVVGSVVVYLVLTQLLPQSTFISGLVECIEQLSLLVGVILYIKEAPDRRKQFHYNAWGAVDAAASAKVSQTRIMALQDLNADGVSLRGFHGEGLDLSEVKLPRVDLRQANFKNAKLDECDVSRGNLSYASFTRASCVKGNFAQVKLDFAHCDEANFNGATFAQAMLFCADFSGANLSGVNFQRASLKGVSFQGAVLAGADFTGADVDARELQKGVLSSTRLPDGSLSE